MAIIADIDIYRAARLLIKEHGDDAPVMAAMRADRMLAVGDMDGRAVWLRILRAVDKLISRERPADSRVH